MRTKITNDWLKEFPEYKKSSSCSMDKIIGPIVMGIGYEVCYSTEYRPGSSVCNLLNAPKDTYAALSKHPKSRRSSLTWEQHEKGLYLEAVQELKNDGPLPLEGPLTLSQVLDAYTQYHGTEGFFRHELEDPVLYALWAGKHDLAKELFHEAVPIFRKEIDEKLAYNQTNPGRYKDPENEYTQWIAMMNDLLIKPKDYFDQKLEQEIIRHKLDKIPRYDLIIDVD